jgi:hypothetical protein
VVNCPFCLAVRFRIHLTRHADGMPCFDRHYLIPLSYLIVT